MLLENGNYNEHGWGWYVNPNNRIEVFSLIPRFYPNDDEDYPSSSIRQTF